VVLGAQVLQNSQEILETQHLPCIQQVLEAQEAQEVLESLEAEHRNCFRNQLVLVVLVVQEVPSAKEDIRKSSPIASESRKELRNRTD
jgi:hypothetical protein